MTSILEKYRDTIAKERKKGTTFERLVVILKDQNITISKPGLAAFCKRRGIRKGIGETQPGYVPFPGRPEAPIDGRLKQLASITAEAEASRTESTAGQQVGEKSFEFNESVDNSNPFGRSA